MHTHGDGIGFVGIVLDYFEPYWFWAWGGGLFAIGLLGLYPLRLESDIGSHQTVQIYLRRLVLGYIAAVLTIGIGAVLAIQSAGAPFLGSLMAAYAWDWGPFIIASLALGLIIRLGYHRYVDPRISAFLRSMRVQQATDALSDIAADIGGDTPIDYLPRDYYRDGEVFLGLTLPAREPAYVDLAVWRETNKTVVGATRYGKGICYQIWAEQAIARGDCLFVIDPKHDKFLPRVIEAACKRAGRRYIELNLADPDTVGRWAPFEGGTAANRRSRFNSIMELEERGTDADHYKARTREELFDLWGGPGRTSLQAINDEISRRSGQSEDVLKDLSGIRARMKEWLGYPKLQPKPDKGHSIEKSLLGGAVVYVKGSLDDQVLRAATIAYITEVMQEAKRLEKQRTTHCSLYIDELRFLISNAILNGLATRLGVGLDIATAYQSFGDLESPTDVRIDGKALRKSLLINSQIKFVFGGTEAETAEYIAENTGTTLKRVVLREQTEVNRSGGEAWAGHRMLGNEEEQLIPMNRILALPRRVGVLFLPHELAKIVSVDKVPLELEAAAAPTILAPSPAR